MGDVVPPNEVDALPFVQVRHRDAGSIGSTAGAPAVGGADASLAVCSMRHMFLPSCVLVRQVRSSSALMVRVFRAWRRAGTPRVLGAALIPGADAQTTVGNLR